MQIRTINKIDKETRSAHVGKIFGENRLKSEIDQETHPEADLTLNEALERIQKHMSLR